MPLRLPPAADLRKLEHLGAEECWRLVGRSGIGRVGFAGDVHVRIVPTRYDAHSGTAYFRADVFGGLARGVHQRTTSLQVDDIDPTTFVGWSVLITGTARRVDDVATVASLWSNGRPDPWLPGSDTQWIELPAVSIEGERVSLPG